MRGDDIADRFLDFAVRVLRLGSALPKTLVGKHVGGQLIRCGTSAGANYEEARGAESLSDFVHKLGMSWKETRESCYWLRLIQRAQLVKPALIESLAQESGELSAILSRSLVTARKRRDSKKKNDDQSPQGTQ
jgi:four helix bundle protein